MLLGDRSNQPLVRAKVSTLSSNRTDTPRPDILAELTAPYVREPDCGARGLRGEVLSLDL